MKRKNTPLYLNVYLANRAYGGPEEGGWWYDVGEPLASRRLRRSEKMARAEKYFDSGCLESPLGYLLSVPCPGATYGFRYLRLRPGRTVVTGLRSTIRPAALAAATRKALEEFAHLDDPRGISSLLCEGVVRVVVQKHPARAYPEERPIYE